ncbi:MAG: hypothetical protein ACK52U_08070, partial [Synechococcaceae cyanobacterium]
DALAGPFGRQPLPLAARAGMERFDAAQLGHQLLLRPGRRRADRAGPLGRLGASETLAAGSLAGCSLAGGTLAA